MKSYYRWHILVVTYFVCLLVAYHLYIYLYITNTAWMRFPLAEARARPLPVESTPSTVSNKMPKMKSVPHREPDYLPAAEYLIMAMSLRL